MILTRVIMLFHCISKPQSMEELCHCGHEVEHGRDLSDFDSSRQYFTCPLFQDEGLGCTYFRWVDPEGTEWQKHIIIKLDKKNEELRDDIDNLRREAIDKARRSEETERILKNFKKHL